MEQHPVAPVAEKSPGSDQDKKWSTENFYPMEPAPVFHGQVVTFFFNLPDSFLGEISYITRAYKLGD